MEISKEIPLIYKRITNRNVLYDKKKLCFISFVIGPNKAIVEVSKNNNSLGSRLTVS